MTALGGSGHSRSGALRARQLSAGPPVWRGALGTLLTYKASPRYHLYIQMILLALALQGLAGEQPYTFPRKSQLSNQPGILSIRARIGARRQCAVAVGLCLYRRWSEELSRALVLCPATSSRTIIGSWWPCAALCSMQASARRAALRRVECFSLCCFFKRILASRDTEELHVE